MTAGEAAKIATRPDYIFPLFILKAMPLGIKGLFFASIFSAATQTAAISAMAQTALGFYRQVRTRVVEDRHLVRVSRTFVVLSGVTICLMAAVCSQIQQYKDLFRLAMAMASYTYGALLGMLFLSLMPGRRDARGLVWGVPFTLLLVFALNWQQEAWARYLVTASIVGLVLGTLPLLRHELQKVVWVLLGAAIVMIATYGTMSIDGVEQPIKLAFPWTFPLGTALTLGLGLLLARKPTLAESESVNTSLLREATA
jgi:Na+/proline symporter